SLLSPRQIIDLTINRCKFIFVPIITINSGHLSRRIVPGHIVLVLRGLRFGLREENNALYNKLPIRNVVTFFVFLPRMVLPLALNDNAVSLTEIIFDCIGRFLPC